MAAAEGAPLFEVADLSTLWVDLHIFGADAQHIGAGVPVTVTRLSDGVTAQTTLERVLPGTATASQHHCARHGGQHRWPVAAGVGGQGAGHRGSPIGSVGGADHGAADRRRPGRGLRAAGRNLPHPAGEAGRRDAERAEVLEGLKAGEQVVVAQSFLIKADIEKSTVEEE
jgi:cobalt-zinc-cadmium efflux system membrane fusion protein